MKRLVVIILLGILLFNASAQEETLSKKQKREERREIKKFEAEKNERIITKIIDDRKFVLEADYIKSKNGQTIPVTSNINFIMVDSVKAIFQFGSANTIGINGIGGVTVEGKITNFEVQKNEKAKSYYIQLNIAATGGFYDIQLIITSTGNASAQINALSQHKLEYSGRLLPLQSSRVHKGMSY